MSVTYQVTQTAGRLEIISAENRKIMAKCRRLHNDMLKIRKVALSNHVTFGDILNAIAEIDQIAENSIAAVEGK